MQVTLSLSATIRYNCSSPPVLPLARLRNSSTSVVSLLVVCSDIEFSHAKRQALLLLLLLLLLPLLFPPPARTASLVPALQIFTCPSRFSALCDKPLVDKGGKLNNFSLPAAYSLCFIRRLSAGFRCTVILCLVSSCVARVLKMAGS